MPLLPLHKRAFILLLIAVTAGFGLVLEEYAVAIFWGVVLAILFTPLHRRLQRRMPRRRNLAALATLGVCLVIVILPVTLIGASLVSSEDDVLLISRKGQAIRFQGQGWRGGLRSRGDERFRLVAWHRTVTLLVSPRLASGARDVGGEPSVGALDAAMRPAASA